MVEVLTLAPDGSREIVMGRFALQGNRVAMVPEAGYERAMHSLLAAPVTIPKTYQKVTAESNPAAWLDALPANYNGTRLCARQVVGKADEDGIEDVTEDNLDTSFQIFWGGPEVSKAFDPNEPRDERGRWTTGGPSGYEFLSPNVKENLTFKDAVHALHSSRQAEFRRLSQDIDKQAGLNAVSHDAIGDWSDGAENSIFDEIRTRTDYDTLRYTAAVKGLAAEQKATIPFRVTADGTDSLYRVPMRGTMESIRQKLDASGVQFRTLVPRANAVEVVVFDPGTKMRETMRSFAKSEGVVARQYRGHGEFLGGDTREEGAARFRQVISQFERSHPNLAYHAPQLKVASLDLGLDFFKGGPGSGNFGHAGRPGEVGGSTPGEGGPLLLAAPSLQNQNVANVGGDIWNQQTAIRLESEYEAAKPQLDALTTQLLGSEVDTETFTEDSPPTSWDEVSEVQQNEAQQDWITSQDNIDSEVESQMEMWKEPGWKGQPSEAEKYFGAQLVKDDDWLRGRLEEFAADRDTPLPVTLDSLNKAITLDNEGNVSIFEGALDRANPIDPNQTSFPFAEEFVPASPLGESLREDIQSYVKTAFSDSVKDMVDNADVPEWMYQQAQESLAESWDELDDDYKFNYAKHNLTLESTPHELSAGIVSTPSHWEPFDKGHEGYSDTRIFAHAMSAERIKQVLEDRGLGKYAGGIEKLDHDIWDAWKGSSTSINGTALQLAAAQELGGRFRNPTGQSDTTTIENYISQFHDNAALKQERWDVLKAYVRGKWETTQYILDKAGKDTVQVFRSISIPNVEDLPTEEVAGSRRLTGDIAKYQEIPALEIKRNGVASATVDRDIANDWGSQYQRVVLRAELPRTAVLSIPVYGQNIYEEQEVVIAGTAWKKWDAWKGKAPRFDEVLMKYLWQAA